MREGNGGERREEGEKREVRGKDRRMKKEEESGEKDNKA